MPLLTKQQRKRARKKLRDYEGSSRKRKLNGKRDPLRYANFEMKKAVLERDRYRCRYCQTEVTFQTSNIDHVYPWFKGGITDPINLVTACRPCNHKKGGTLHMRPSTLGNHFNRYLNSLFEPYRNLVGTPCLHKRSPNCNRRRCLEKRQYESEVTTSPDIYAEQKRQLQHLRDL